MTDLTSVVYSLLDLLVDVCVRDVFVPSSPAQPTPQIDLH